MMNPDEMMIEAHRKTLWAHFVAMILGGWLVTSPFTFGYHGRGMVWNDIISGALIVVLSALSVSPRRRTVRWVNCFVGIWLLFAPLVFWAPTAVAYVNDTLVGALVIALAVLVPGMPGMSMEAMMTGPDIPPGWTYNPSTWLQRGPMIALALFSFFVSRYLAAYQLGYAHTAWDPFFGDGTKRVLTSDVSRAWPISDAGLGAVSYLLEALSGFMGDQRRWRTMPWMVLMFGVLVVPLGVTSIVLVILQPVAVGAWCALCLVTAVAMLIMIPLAVDEVVAMGQFLARARREGRPFWPTFWRGGTLDASGEDHRIPKLRSMFWGTNTPPSLVLSVALGIWLMASPAVLGASGSSAHNSELAGAIVTTIAVIAMAEVTRAARFLNVVLGVWIALAAVILAGATAISKWNGAAIGLLIVVLSLRRGKVKNKYGTWDECIF